MYKTIKINNNRNLKKFYRLLPIYKGIFFKHIYFKLEKGNKDLIYIIKSLNIKNRKKRIEYIYDTACNIVDNYYKNKNICNFKNCKCRIQQKKNAGINGCCRYCMYQSKKGCTTKNLICKLFVCTEVSKKYNTIQFNDLKILKVLSIRQRLLLKSSYFSKREDVINDLYIGSLIIGCVRILYRVTRGIIYIKRRKNDKA